MQYLGIQDAPRKRRIDEGPWAGTIYKTSCSEVLLTVTQEKWNKGKGYIVEITKMLNWNPHNFEYLKDTVLPGIKLNFKYLERVRGFLCHLAMTYPILFPYLKGFHLTLCAHLPGRDKEGWKRTDLEQLGERELLREKGLIDEDETKVLDLNTSKEVLPVPRFFWCLKALDTFFLPAKPPSRSVRKAKFHFLEYGFVDASKSGLGSIKSWGNKTTVRMGTWGAD